MQVQLVMFKADGQRKEFSLRKDKTVIGRATECDFQIPLAMVSRRHCQITLEDDNIIVRDLGSSNGTYVNQKRVQEARLKAGDQVVIGPVTFTVIVDGEPADVQAVRAPGAAAPGEPEVDHGTVDVDAEAPAKGEAVEEVEEVAEVEDVEEVKEVEEVAAAPAAPAATEPPAADDGFQIAEAPSEEAPQEEEEELPSDPLAALEAMSRPKRKK